MFLVYPWIWWTIRSGNNNDKNRKDIKRGQQRVYPTRSQAKERKLKVEGNALQIAVRTRHSLKENNRHWNSLNHSFWFVKSLSSRWVPAAAAAAAAGRRRKRRRGWAARHWFCGTLTKTTPQRCGSSFRRIPRLWMPQITTTALRSTSLPSTVGSTSPTAWLNSAPMSTLRIVGKTL